MSEAMTAETQTSLTEGEAKALIMNLAFSRKKKGFTEEEAQRVLDWADEIRVGEEVLNLALAGKLAIDLKGNKVLVNVPEGKMNLVEQLSDR